VAVKLGVSKAGRVCYSDEQLGLFRVFVVEEKCTVHMVIALTGIRRGGVTDLCKKLDIHFHLKQGERNAGGTLGRIQRARKLTLLKQKYAKQIGELFPQK
jgi:hypothetical protein